MHSHERLLVYLSITLFKHTLELRLRGRCDLSGHGRVAIK